jgi:hypothetical protein
MVFSSQSTNQLHNDFADVVSFLKQPAAFDESTINVDVMQTHGSLVFLGKNHVFKIKRPVKFSYMDFSTLAKRKANCEREYELNKAIAPELYLGVFAITRESDGRLMIDGAGAPIEWAVKIKRFPEQDILYNIARDHELSDQLALKLGERIANYHHELVPLSAQDGVQYNRDVIDQIEQFFFSSASDIEPPLIRDSINHLKTAFLEVESDFKNRAQSGFIRRCHGDLHLKNIVLIKGVPTPFDALEFDERLATIDVVYDLSFLLMDLASLGLKQKANLVLHRYFLKAWSLVGVEGVRILPFCLGLRAAIRAMVTCQIEPADEVCRQQKMVEATKYLTLVSKVLNKTPPVLIAIGGLSGTGKSTLAQRLASQVKGPLGAVLLRSDLERKEMLGVSEFKHLKTDHYTPEMGDRVYERLFEKASNILSAGQSVILDAVFLSADKRWKARNIAEKQQIPFCGFYLDAPLPVLLARVTARQNDASDADAQVVQKQYAQREQMMTLDYCEWSFLDASGSKQETLDLATEALKQKKIL